MLSKDRLRFINSLQFMSASLDKLVANLPIDAFVHLDRHTTHTELLKRKGVYPYDYVDGPARLEETRLPPQSGSARPASPMSTTPTAKTFDMSTLADYLDMYLLTDVLLLADVFEQFRFTCMAPYGLDPAHYYTAPGLS